jgi:large repetitive protein
MADGRTCKVKVPVVVATGSVESHSRTVDCGSVDAHASHARLRLLRRAARWLQLLLSLFLLCLPLQAQSGAAFQYIYDSNGQLLKVVDSSGNVVTYAYDSVGNILSISRSTIAGANTLAILNFTPQQGATGQVVTIQGQNFSSSPSGNAVAFNGTPASVTSASSNSLTVVVPAGAATGPISVQVGASTATSANNFTIQQIPVIASVSPKSALQGGSIGTFQVTGANLGGSSFSFLPVFSPPAITASNVVISPDGSSATMSLALSPSASGSFTVLATNTAGSSSQLASPNNTLTVLSNNPSADADGDGLTNIYEGAISSDPLNPSSANDGIPDGWALFFGLNPSNPNGAGQTAPDGLTYLQAFQQGLNPLIPTLAPPDVARVFPADASTNYPTNGVVVVRFNEPLQSPVTLASAQAAITAGLPPGSNFSSSNAAAAAQVLQAFLLRTCCGGTAAVPGTVQLLQNGRPIAGTVILSNDGLSLVFAPTKPLSSSTTYTVVVTGVKGASGIVMTNTFQSSFTTGLTTNLTTGNAVLTSPANGATNVPTNAAFMVEFTKQIDPSSLTSQTFFIFDSQTSQRVPGILQVDPSGFTAAFVPQSQYPVGRTMFVELNGVLDLTENRFPFSFFSFTTGFAPATQGPALIALSPASGTGGIPVNSLVVAQFSQPVSVINAINGFQVLQGSTPVLGAIALSNGNTQLTFTPVSPLSPNTPYTISVTSQITDVAENPLTNPGAFTFVTGAAADNTTPSVTTVGPANGAGGVPTNGVIQLQFSKRVNPLTVNTADFIVFPQATGIPIPGTIAVSADGLTATFTPASPLSPSTGYFIEATGGILDLEGQGLQFFFSSFGTGLGAVTTAPTVLQVSPTNGELGVPVNPQVVIVVSAPVSAASVGSSAIAVSAGGTPVNGSISLSGDRTALTFVPANLLAVNTTYTVTASGFTDQAGNRVVSFSSTFTTGTAGVADTTRPTVSTVSPVNGATGVATSSTIVLTFNEPIDAATVNVNTVPIFGNGFSGQLAGSYTVDATGKVVTFTPVSALPGNTLIIVEVNGVTDLAGNGNNFFESTFTTGAGTDTTPPTVLAVTPGNGASGIGLNAGVVLTFSKSLNRNTINNNTVGLLVNGSKLGIGISVSADNRAVTLNAFTLPASSTVTVIATTGVTDLAGNGLGNFESSFTTAAAFDTDHPGVVAQRPGNGATGVPLNSSVVLYLSEPMNAGTVPGALHVSQNGVLASGTTQVSDSGQVVVFTPAQPWQNNALVQVFLDGTAQDVDGSNLNAYQGSFRTAIDTTGVAPTAISTSPQCCGAVPTNVVIDVGFNETLNPATVNTTTVSLVQDVCCNFPVVASTVSLVNGGTVVQVTPNAPLAANTTYFVQINTGLQGTNGLAFPFTQNVVFFVTGTGSDTVAPTIVSVSPPNGSVNVGDNALVRVAFSKPVNPLTVNGRTIQLTGGGTTEVADAISFSNNNQSVVLTPHAPLPDNTVMTLTISGVTDVAGNAITPQTTTFTVGTGPSVTAPSVINENPFSGATNVAVNTPIQLQINKPLDPGTVNGNTLFIEDDFTFQQVAGTGSLSGDGRTINFLPAVPLPVSRTFSVFFAFRGITDLEGNQLDCSVLCNYSFTTGTTTDVAGPSVVGVSPANGLTGVPINTQVVVEFSEPVDDLTLAQITLSGGGGPVNVISRLSNANQTLTLVPVVPLNTGTTYTVSVTGVQDLSGNPLATPVTTSFTTGTGADLTPPVVTTVSPANGAGGVPTNGVIQLQFSKRVNPLTVNTADFIVFPQATGIPIPGTIAVSADGLTATFTPASPLSPSTGYFIEATGGILDLEGQGLQFFFSSFGTGTQ